MKKLIKSVVLTISLLLPSVGSAEICTPVTVNPSAIQRISPRMGVGAVQSIMGCFPTERMVSEMGVTILRFAIPKTSGGVYVAFDAMGVSFAEYIDPLLVSYSGAFRVSPPLQPIWIPAAGMLNH